VNLHAVENLERYLAAELGAAETRIHGLMPLSGGAIQLNWGFDLLVSSGSRAGQHAMVLKSDAVAQVRESRSRLDEFELLRAAHAAGVTVPEPVACCADPAVIGSPFLVMRRVRGSAAPHLLVKRAARDGGLDSLAVRLAEELARIHTIDGSRWATCASSTAGRSALPARVGEMRAHLLDLTEPRPALEWGLRWLELQPVPAGALVLGHRDFRTGNFLVDPETADLTAILDWEFAGLTDYHEDLGWFCARCWRFGNDAMEAGGIARRRTFIDAYTAASGRAVDALLLRAWEVAAHIRWALIATDQAERHLSGKERSLMLALTGVIVPELELEVLTMTESG
jgi:aminoglycoside phosphotransferase (APT) family kinase protein